MKRTLGIYLPPTLVFLGLALCCFILWHQTARFRRSVEGITEDVRISLIDMDGRVVYDSTGRDLPNHSDRAEFEAVRTDGRSRSVVRESGTLHMAMFYHARRVGNCILRIAVPYRAVIEAKAYARIGLIAASAIGALIIFAILLFVRRYEKRLARLAEEHRLQQKLLAEMRKLETFRRNFISNVTHEIKTPVTGILGAIELLADETNAIDEQDRKELQKVLRDQSVRLNALVEDILALAHLEKAESDHAMESAPCNVADIIHTALNLARPVAARAGVVITFDPSAAEAAIIRPCDPRLIESAVTNLVQNVIRHSRSSRAEISVSLQPDGRAAIRVTDHGIGIPAECQARLFERFYRVDKDRSRASGGTGLGLAIVKHIAQLHGGSVSVSSTPGEGASFTLMF